MPAKAPSVKPISKEGRARVDAALEKLGLLLVQGQWEIPSLADLLQGAPVKTRGFSYDYMPAWNLREELLTRDDIALCKLFRGKSTLVHKRHWPLVDGIARLAQRGVEASRCKQDRYVMYEVIKARPGITGEKLKHKMELAGKPGSAAFQRAKADLESWLCIVGVESTDKPADESHTHDQAWHVWGASKIAKAVNGSAPELTLLEAADGLMRMTYPDGLPAELAPMKKLYPALSLLS